MTDTNVRLAQPSDLAQLALLRTALWPDSSEEHHAQELAQILAGKSLGIMPLVVLVSQNSDGTLLGFLEVGLRSYADGCDVSHPVGYVEGWYVAEHSRKQGIGAALLRAAENWARGQGCTEIASDTTIDNHVSQRVHESVGFQVAERSVLYRKTL